MTTSSAVSALSPPPSINPAALDLWFEAVAGVENEQRDHQWSLALRSFGVLCRNASVNPFLGLQHRNPEIRNFLRAQRRRIVRAMDDTKIMEGTVPRRLLERNAEVGKDGFSITVSVQVRIDDPTWAKRLTRFKNNHNFRLMRKSSTEVELVLNAASRMFVSNALMGNRTMWKIGYTIVCPVIPDLAGVPPGQEQNFVLRQLWKPMQDQIRPDRADRILHL